MKKRKSTPVLVSVLLCILVLTFSGCSQKASAEGNDLMKDLKAESVEKMAAYIEEDNTTVLDFSLELLRMNLGPKNTLISPLSVLSALGMTANGARESTLLQMEEVFGLKREKINGLLSLYMSRLPDEDKLRVSMANSIWFREGGRINVNRDFLQTNANYYQAGVFRAPFDETTLRNINQWVSTETDGIIESILDEITDDSVMYLISALSFDAEWETPYFDYAIKKFNFTAEDGSLQSADMMFSAETLYLEDEGTKGFIKNYAGGKYAFLALLPPEDLPLSEYIATLTGEKLHRLMKNPEIAEVGTMLPKFTTEYAVELSDLLIRMGMEDAFDPEKADLLDLGTAEENLFISSVVHKTKIEVDERGTKAGAATLVEVAVGSAGNPELKTVHLDRPFLYLIMDTESYLPLFIGTTLSVE